MKKRRLSFFICFIFVILSILSVIYFDYSIALLNNIEDFLRLIISILFPLITFIFVLLYLVVVRLLLVMFLRMRLVFYLIRRVMKVILFPKRFYLRII